MVHKDILVPPDKNHSMSYHQIPLCLVIILGIFLAGCTQSSAPAPVTPVTPVALQTTIPPSVPVTTVPAPEATVAQVVTVIHQVSQVHDIRDSALLFTLQVPVEWNVTTYRLSTAEDPEMMVYQTDLVSGNIFYIRTYTVSRSQDQAYRDQFRKWTPAPVETTVTINSIVYDRFESDSDGRTTVAYVARKSSANERGYASVIVFISDDSKRFEKDDYERVVSTFRYFPASSAGTMTGTEIARGNPPYIPSGGSASGKAGSSESAVSGGCSRCGVS
jgi:hypothetical protein